MSERRLLVTLCYGPTGAAMAALSLDLLRAYAARCRADFFVMTDVTSEPPPLDDMKRIHASLAVAMLDKMRFLRQALGNYERILWIDLDIMVRPDAPNLFDLVPPTTLAMADECTTGNDYQVWFCHNHMVETCQQEHLPVPDTRGRYFNCGLMMIPATAQHLFVPRVNPVVHPWCEQSLINIRLALAGTDVYVLPECCNRFMYWPGMVPRRQADMSWFLHFAGPPDYATRLHDMRELRERWKIAYPAFDWSETSPVQA